MALVKAPARLVTGFALLLAGASCREASLRLAPTPADAAQPVDLAGALAARFGPMEREPSFDALRPRLAQAALVPSRVFDDAGAWTRVQGDERTVEFRGRAQAGHYRMGVCADPPARSEPGSYRATLRLRRIGEGRFGWRMREELAVGAVRGDDLASALTVLFLASERASEAEARFTIRQSLPRAAEAFGRLLSLETLRLEANDDGGAAVTLGIRLQPQRLRAAAPRYAAYLDKYATPIRLKAVAGDAAGLVWWEVEARDNLATLRCRVKNGRLAPLKASPRPIPDRLRLRTEYSTKAGPFRVGVDGLEADLSLVREPREKGFVAAFVRPPDWRLPFLIEPFLRGSLRYPFEGDGSLLAFSVRDEPGEPTRFVYEYRLPVRESWIVRWIGGLTSAAVDEFRRGAEDESDRFTGECLLALREDLRQLVQDRGR
jgi:hypothetical protein